MCTNTHPCAHVSARAHTHTHTHTPTHSNDAGLAAAEVALEVERSVLATNSVDTVGTTGIFDIKPNAINSVPREAKLGIGRWG